MNLDRRCFRIGIGVNYWVNWEYFSTTEEAIKHLREKVPGIQIVAVEQDKKSVPFTIATYQFPLALMVSNETSGATQSVLSLADTIVEIPMWGVNKSLNVMVSLAIVLFQAVQTLPTI